MGDQINDLPLPVALLVYQAKVHADDQPKKVFDWLISAWEASVQLAVLFDPPSSEQSKNRLYKPTLGDWCACVPSQNKRSRRPELQELMKLLHREGKPNDPPFTDRDVSAAQLFDTLAPFRNQASTAHSSPRRDTFYSDANRVLISGILAAWQEGWFLPDSTRMIFVRDIKVADNGDHVAKRISLMGRLSELENEPIVLPVEVRACRVYFVNAGEYRCLHPWVLYNPSCDRVYLYSCSVPKLQWLDISEGQRKGKADFVDLKVQPFDPLNEAERMSDKGVTIPSSDQTSDSARVGRVDSDRVTTSSSRQIFSQEVSGGSIKTGLAMSERHKTHGMILIGGLVGILAMGTISMFAHLNKTTNAVSPTNSGVSVGVSVGASAIASAAASPAASVIAIADGEQAKVLLARCRRSLDGGELDLAEQYCSEALRLASDDDTFARIYLARGISRRQRKLYHDALKDQAMALIYLQPHSHSQNIQGDSLLVNTATEEIQRSCSSLHPKAKAGRNNLRFGVTSFFDGDKVSNVRDQPTINNVAEIVDKIPFGQCVLMGHAHLDSVLKQTQVFVNVETMPDDGRVQKKGWMHFDVVRPKPAPENILPPIVAVEKPSFR